jgi:hypothetical protein
VAISGSPFFSDERNSPGLRGIRTVSLFSPGAGEAEAERTEAGNGVEAGGGFGGPKKFVDDVSSRAECGEEENGDPPVSRTGN